jgi:hypothetical protein
MSVFTKVFSGLGKFENFIVNIFTKEQQVQQTLVALATPTKAALMATFYDVVKAVQAGEGAVAAGMSGNIPAAITLSVQTIALVKGVIEDAKTDASVAHTDLTALGISVETNPTPVTPTPPPPAVEG